MVFMFVRFVHQISLSVQFGTPLTLAQVSSGSFTDASPILFALHAVDAVSSDHPSAVPQLALLFPLLVM